MSPQAKKRLQSILAGFGGGLAPFLVNLAQALVGNTQLKTSLSIGYFIGILIFGLIGAFMPLILRELNPGKAFFLGISAPAMISLAAKDSNARVSAVTQATTFRSSFAIIASAYAQEATPASQPVEERSLEIELDGTMPEATVAFIDAAGHEVKTDTIKLHENKRSSVPPTATAIQVRYGDSVTKRYPLSTTADYAQYVLVTGAAGQKKLDISSAFTGQAKILYDINVIGPRVYLQIADESQRDLAKKIQAFLIEHSFVAPGVENVSGKAYIPDTVEVRYRRNPEDKDKAEAVLAILKNQFHITNCRTSYTERGPRDRPGHIEIWFSKNIKRND